MSDNFRPKIDISGVNFRQGPLINDGTDDIMRISRSIQREKEEERERYIAYNERNIAINEEKVELLRDIKSSLKGLDDVVYLLSRSVSHQEETLELMKGIFSIGTAPDEETAHSRYQSVKKKIHEITDDVESAKTLITLAKYIYTTAIGLL